MLVKTSWHQAMLWISPNHELVKLVDNYALYVTCYFMIKCLSFTENKRFYSTFRSQLASFIPILAIKICKNVKINLLTLK